MNSYRLTIDLITADPIPFGALEPIELAKAIAPLFADGTLIDRVVLVPTPAAVVAVRQRRRWWHWGQRFEIPAS